MPKINVEIGRNGSVKLEGVGFTGKACQGVLDTFTRALGADPTAVSREAKPEMFEQGTAVEQVGE